MKTALVRDDPLSRGMVIYWRNCHLKSNIAEKISAGI
jgi:hypothetical protein